MLFNNKSYRIKVNKIQTYKFMCNSSQSVKHALYTPINSIGMNFQIIVQSEAILKYHDKNRYITFHF